MGVPNVAVKSAFGGHVPGGPKFFFLYLFWSAERSVESGCEALRFFLCTPRVDALGAHIFMHAARLQGSFANGFPSRSLPLCVDPFGWRRLVL
jgi:hypothetical protein